MSQRDTVRAVFKTLPPGFTFEQALEACKTAGAPWPGAVQYVWREAGKAPPGGSGSAPARSPGEGPATPRRAPTATGEPSFGPPGSVRPDMGIYIPKRPVGRRRKDLSIGRPEKTYSDGDELRTVSLGEMRMKCVFRRYLNGGATYSLDGEPKDKVLQTIMDEFEHYTDKELRALLDAAPSR